MLLTCISGKIKHDILTEIEDGFRLKACKDTICVKYKHENEYIIKEDKNYLFIHVPKNAGTYIRQIFPGMNSFNDHLTIMEMRKLFPKIINQCMTFAVIRNPWERCVSMYTNSINTKKNDIKNWGTHGLNIMKHHNVKSFADFVTLLYKFRKNLKELGEIVWLSQSHFICDEHNNILVNKIIRIENLEPELLVLKNMFSIKKNHNNSKINVSNVYNHAYKMYYDPDIKKMVDIIYKNDIFLTKYVY
jgi:hypothetical protein